MKKHIYLKFIAIIGSLSLMLVACSTPSKDDFYSNGNANSNISDEVTMVEITDVHGPVLVPKNPKNVVALDNRTFETLSDWGIELAILPKPIMPSDISYTTDDSVLDIGNHREPNLEIMPL